MPPIIIFANTNWITFYLVLLKWFLYFTFFFRKHTYIIFCIFMSITVMTTSSYFHFRILEEWMLLSHSLPSSVYQFVCLHYQSLIKLHASILEPSIEHWYLLNILITMGMHIFELGILAWQWHSMQDPKIHYNVIQVLAVTSSCIPWINSVPLLKNPHYLWPPHKTAVWNEWQKKWAWEKPLLSVTV